MPERSFRFRRLQRFLRFFRDAAVICHVVGGERLRCICNFTRRSSLSRLFFVFFSSPRSLRSPLQHTRDFVQSATLRLSLFFSSSVSENAARRWRNLRSFGEPSGRGRQTVAKLLAGTANDCLRFVPNVARHHPECAPAK